MNKHDLPHESFDEKARKAASNNQFKFVRVGIWNLFFDLSRRNSRIQLDIPSRVSGLGETIPYLWRYMSDVRKAGGDVLVFDIALSAINALLPAVSLYYSGELLRMIQATIEKREIDQGSFIHIAAAHAVCSIAAKGCNRAKFQNASVLKRRIEAHFREHILHAHARLDVPTFNDAAVQSRLGACFSGDNSVGWTALSKIIHWSTNVLQLLSQLLVIANMLQGQKNDILLALLCFVAPLFMWIGERGTGLWNNNWVAYSSDVNYIKLEGLSRCTQDARYRHEIVAGNLQSYIQDKYRAASKTLGDASMSLDGARQVLHATERGVPSFLYDLVGQAPELFIAARALKAPSTIPVSLASLKVLQEKASTLSSLAFVIWRESQSLLSQFRAIRNFYEIINIPNKVVDGNEPYPIDTKDGKVGAAIEFKNVSFRYPDAEKDALRDVSFSIKPGQLCVIVGANGEGKSSIIKLLNRIYDCTSGQILFDGKDIRSLRLADVHRRTSVLYQDYQHFPVSIGENIGMGDPQDSHNDLRIREAAKLGGAADFVNSLPESFDTLLDSSTGVYMGGDNPDPLFERIVSSKLLRRSIRTSLSGGQMQRLALSRTFMQPDGDVTLCLYDEPSAALDPQAEYDLFQRLCALKGEKTMVFSSHRFGHLTKHADIILYMKDATVCEAGTHAELLAEDGLYAKLYNIQAQAFL
ncbi:hypothetical protein BOTBODRAFT_379709 [Botryobasidium botryosum FD-172 SS1]|uniref:ABC transporter domain-containing protein n=1 Tax=Botryobasidium botryosum (strain FD-172 SS1) TaxID=930990 RepID=A0A067N7Y0_BOTB1|nr:hypothetical protein BOTBODRAFT_379709 [Botryobasidium botryosum FD-172 SS1]